MSVAETLHGSTWYYFGSLCFYFPPIGYLQAFGPSERAAFPDTLPADKAEKAEEPV